MWHMEPAWHMQPARHTAPAWHMESARHTAPARHTELARHTAPARQAESAWHAEPTRHTESARHVEPSHLKRAQQVDTALQRPSSRLRALHTSDRHGSRIPALPPALPPPPPPTLSRQGAPTSQIREKDEDSGGGRGCVLCQGAHGLSDSDNHRGASLERPQKLQHCLNSCPGAPGRQRAGCGGGQGGCPAHRQTCAFSVAWDNPGPLADRWASAQSLC